MLQSAAVVQGDPSFPFGPPSLPPLPPPVPPVQTPVAQSWPVWHGAQAAALMPQLVGLWNWVEMHWLPEQQPLGHGVVPHIPVVPPPPPTPEGGTHAPFWQMFVPMQAVHAMPLVPHAPLLVPATQAPLVSRQPPLAHVPPVHAFVVMSQVAPPLAAQSVQATPPLPQAVLVIGI